MNEQTMRRIGFVPSMTILLCLALLPATVVGMGLPAGSQTPQWTLVDGNGEEFSYPEDLQDRPAVILFWATWCPYCKAVMPWLNQIAGEFSDDGVQVLALNFREDGDPEAYLAEKGFDFVHFPQADDVAAAFAVRFTPGIFVVDSKGVVLYNRYDDDETPDAPNEAQASHAQKASVRAPHWAGQVRAHLQQALGAAGPE